MGSNLKTIQRVTIIGMIANIILSVAKIAAGVLGHSRAVAADGVHSLSDLVTDAAVLIGAKYWESPADKTHPHGHRRIETLVSLFIAVALFFVAIGLGWDAVKSFKNTERHVPGLIALIAALASIIVKEILYQWTVKEGKKIKSSALIANAWHHRSDALSSIPAVLAVAAAMLFPDITFIDAAGAIVVTVFIAYASWKIAKPALWELTDAGAPAETCIDIEKIACNTPGVKAVHKCRTRHLGSGLEVDLHIEVDSDISVKQGHEIAGAVKHNLLENGPDIVDVIVHMEPYAG